MDIAGKVVIGTAASSVIGAAFARRAGQYGATVFVAARCRQRIGELSAELSDAIAVPTDATIGDLDAAMRRNVNAPLVAMQKVLPIMRARR